LNAECAGRFESIILRDLAWVELGQGDPTRALEYCRAGISTAFQQGDHNIIASCLGLCANLAARQGLPERAAQLSGASRAMYTRQKRVPWEDSSLDTLLPGWHERPDHPSILRAFEGGLTLSAEQAMALSLDDQAG
jgi:hypothetical protein